MTQELREYGKQATAAASTGKKAVASSAPPPSTADPADRLSSQPLNNADIPCAFWDALPEPGTDHPDLLSIEALKAESSVLERAETLKVIGEVDIGIKKKTRPLFRGFFQLIPLRSLPHDNTTTTRSTTRSSAGCS